MSKPITCLLIDDDREEPEIFNLALKKLKLPAEFFSVSSGEEALLFLNSSTKPDIIFLDLNMAPMTGAQCLKEIRKIKNVNTVPVIIYSTSSVLLQKNEIGTLGATGFIRKTSSLNDLRELLDECFATHCFN
jgi:CheY-like chemotaxis protein